MAMSGPPARGATRRPALATAVACLATTLALIAPAPTPAAAAPAPGFADTVVLSGLTDPTTVRFSPDGRVFVAEKSGLIKVFDGLGDTTPTVFADLRTQVHNYWDRGLLGLALDPAFPTQPWVYVLYTRDAAIGGNAPLWGTAGTTSDPCPTPPGPTTGGCVVSGRLSRLQAAGDSMTGTEKVLVEDWCQQYPGHSVGDLEFGMDGSLYASAGDGASFTFMDYGQNGSPTNPCGDPPVGVGGAQTPPGAQGGAMRSQDARTPGDPQGLDGTVIRVDPTTGAGLPGNPLYASTDPNARRLVATGLRNPFRMAMRPGTSELYLGDVGNGGWEEINGITAPTDGTLDNFGWPCYEGVGRHAPFETLGLSVCEDLYDAGGVTPPALSYSHDGTVVAGEACPTGSSSISGIEFYQGGAYPSAYDSAAFFADYSRDCIWAVPPGGAPQTLVAAAANPVDLEIGPGGDLFYVDLDGGAIHRLTWTQAQPPAGSAYLSDLAWTRGDNGWGPVERDRSNGEDLAADGGTIRLNGVSSAKGLGVHAASDVRIDLGGRCSRFQSDIGIDDEVDAGGSVSFEVWADGTRLYRSAVLTATSATQQVDLPVAGAQTLRLVVDGGGDVTSDHADWASARVTCGSTDTTAPTVTARAPVDGATGVASGSDITATFSEALDATTVNGSAFTLVPSGGSTPVPATVAYDAGNRTVRLDPSGPLADATRYVARLAGGASGVADLAGNRLAGDQSWSFTTATDEVTTTYLSDRPRLSATNGWGPVELDRSNGEDASGDGRALTLAGQAYTKGLGAHARSVITYDLAADCSRFQADIGVDDEIDAGGSVTFEVLGDGTRLHLSPVMTAASATGHLDLPVTGVRQLQLVADGGADITRDHADWAGARVTCGSDAAVDPEVHIDTPTVQTTWAVGDQITFSGGAVDGRGEPLPTSALTWSLVMHHCPSNCHTHSVQSWAQTASGSFRAPDHEFPSYLELQLTAALPGGGSVSDSVELDPRTTPLTFQSNPGGLPLVVGSASGQTPFTREVITGSICTISAAATQVAGTTSYDFSSWSDGGARSHDVVAPPTPTTLTARYVPTVAPPFRALDDLNGRPGDANGAGVTRFRYTSSGAALVDAATGSAAGPTITGSSTGGLDPKTTGGAQAAAGTDAARWFGTTAAPVVDLGRSVELDATAWSNTATIDGLDPRATYAITLTANHGDARFGNARFTRVTLNGAPSYVNASSAGVVAYAPNSVSFNTGYNTQRGYVARWTGVTAGADGRISVTSQWDQSRGAGTANNRGYAMTALLLEH